MRSGSVALAAILACTLLSGCTGGNGSGAAPSDAATQEARPVLTSGKGAITGIVIDDVYRPVPGALVLLTPAGLTATADGEGQFSFADLDPGSYLAQVSAKDHEAAPVPVDVKAGQYTEAELLARRVFSQNSTILTTEYSVFIDCSAEVVVEAIEGIPCTLDQSGDSDRGSFDTRLTPQDANLTTWMVTEFLFNNAGYYDGLIGTVDDTNSFNHYFAEGESSGGRYIRFQNEAGKADHRTGEDAGRNEKWMPAGNFTTGIFPHSATYPTLHDASKPAHLCVGDGGCLGAGPVLGVEAKIIQSVFLGPPPSGIDAYAVLKPQ